jgi:repressor LexA
MARTPPGETRARVLAAVRKALEHGRSPSLREVQRAVGLRSPEVVRQHVLQIVEAGALERDEGARGWRLPGRERARVVHVPLLGRVPAGGPIEAVEEHEGVVAFDASRRRAGSAGLFALRVEGLSMRDAGILPGDVVIVDARARAEHGDVVVARLDGDATVKRLWRPVDSSARGARQRLELRPANPAFAPIVPAPGQDFALLGKVIELRRDLF